MKVAWNSSPLFEGLRHRWPSSPLKTGSWLRHLAYCKRHPYSQAHIHQLRCEIQTTTAPMLNRSKKIILTDYLRRARGALLAGLFMAAALSACAEHEKVSTNYMVINHTDAWVIDVTVNKQGGVLIAGALGQSGRACCVTLPKAWRPDLRVTIGWRDDSAEQLDASGKPIMHDGKPVLIRGQSYSRTAPIQEYSRDQLGTMYIHILPDKNVIVVTSMLTPGHPEYLPKNPLQRQRLP